MALLRPRRHLLGTQEFSSKTRKIGASFGACTRLADQIVWLEVGAHESSYDCLINHFSLCCILGWFLMVAIHILREERLFDVKSCTSLRCPGRPLRQPALVGSLHSAIFLNHLGRIFAHDVPACSTNVLERNGRVRMSSKLFSGLLLWVHQGGVSTSLRAPPGHHSISIPKLHTGAVWAALLAQQAYLP